MVEFGQSGCNRAEWLYSSKVVVFGQKWLYSGKVVIFGKNGCIRAKVVALGQSGCIRTKGVVFGQKWLYSGKVVVFGQSGCISTKWLCFSVKIPCIRARTLYSGKSCCNRANVALFRKVVLFGQKWLYSANVVVIGQNLLYSGKNGCIPERGCI